MPMFRKTWKQSWTLNAPLNPRIFCVKYYTDLHINLLSKGFKQEMLDMLLIISESGLTHLNSFVHTGATWSVLCCVCDFEENTNLLDISSQNKTMDGTKQLASLPAVNEVTSLTALYDYLLLLYPPFHQNV